MVLSRLLCFGLGAPALQCHYGFGFELSSGGPGFGTVSVHIEYLTVMGLQTVTRFLQGSQSSLSLSLLLSGGVYCSGQVLKCN